MSYELTRRRFVRAINTKFIYGRVVSRSCASLSWPGLPGLASGRSSPARHLSMPSTDCITIESTLPYTEINKNIAN
jgi:hypothetical protein